MIAADSMAPQRPRLPVQSRVSPVSRHRLVVVWIGRIVAAILLAGSMLPAHAQLPGLKSGQAAAEKPTEPAPTDEAAIRAQLVAAQAEFDRVASSPNQAIDAPEGATPNQLVIRQTLLRQLVRAYQQRLDDILSLGRLREQRESVERRLARWRIDPARAPFSMVEVESLRREIQQCLRRIDVASARLDSLDSQTEALRFSARQSDQSARQLLERIEARSGRVDLLAWDRDLMLLRGRVAIATLDTQVAQRSLRQEERAVARADLDFLNAQLALTAGKVVFSEKDRNTLTGGLEARLKTLEPELGAALSASEAARQVFEEARAELVGAGDRVTPQARERLVPAAALAELRFGVAQARVDAVRLMVEVSEAQRAAWGYWYDIVQASDSDTARQLNAVLDSYRDSLVKIDVSTRAAFRLTLSQIDATDRRIDAAAPADATFERQRSALLRERAQWQARLLAESMSAADLLDRWRDGFVRDAGRGGGALAIQYWWHRGLVAVRSLWDFELFSAQDTIEVEGRKIVAERSITLGKVATAVLILVVGLWVAGRAIRASTGLAVRYVKADQNSARLVGKWVFALVFIVLFLLSLVTVKIPFTVFAFLGGAVAIGVGFGMQTLLKNLISGLMLLIERPFRLGDVVEVGGVRGTVADINVRSSLIRDRNGIETLVPNSTFLEQNVTNWTYSLTRVRFSLIVGVAYGSPVEKVRDLLTEAAERHGLVMRNPGPEVFFQDFAADALSFSLQYWLDLDAKVDSQRVASDLRYMIEKSFAQAGIVIAYPQRDLHLDVAQPIPVQVVPGSAAGKAEEGEDAKPGAAAAGSQA